jgi:hypothetical protein
MRLGRLRQVHAWVGRVPGWGFAGVWVRGGVCGGGVSASGCGLDLLVRLRVYG